MIRNDLTGRRFGGMVVLRLDGIVKYDGTTINLWKCRCDCGTKISVAQPNLRRKTKRTHGCGHNQGEQHRLSKTKEYRSWGKMKKRCYDLNHWAYKYYGARGVKVHKSWKKSFLAFLNYIGLAPSPKHTVDRYPNPRGHYEPGNVRWATQTEQNRNR